jgi:hypothetical protein
MAPVRAVVANRKKKTYTLNIVAGSSSECLVTIYQKIRHQNPENQNLNAILPIGPHEFVSAVIRGLVVAWCQVYIETYLSTRSLGNQIYCSSTTWWTY